MKDWASNPIFHPIHEVLEAELFPPFKSAVCSQIEDFESRILGNFAKSKNINWADVARMVTAASLTRSLR